MRRTLGKTGLEVTPISFGGASISGEGGGYGFGEIDEDQAIGLLLYAFDRGINLFDTAPIYGFGLSEKRMGKAFKKMREKVILVSKGGVGWHQNKRVNMSNDPKQVQSMLEQSLKDLQTDYIDLYMIHWPDPRVDIRKALEVLMKAKEQQKILHIGLCNTNAEDLIKAKEVCEVEVVQSQLNLFEGPPKEVRDELGEDNLGFMSWGTLDKGILSDRIKADRKYDKVDARSWAPWWKNSPLADKLAAVERVQPFLKKHGLKTIHLALGFNLNCSYLSTCLVGARSEEQLDQLLQVIEEIPSNEIIEKGIEVFRGRG